jgi:hypothetical protein
MLIFVTLYQFEMFTFYSSFDCQFGYHILHVHSLVKPPQLEIQKRRQNLSDHMQLCDHYFGSLNFVKMLGSVVELMISPNYRINS